MDRFKCNNILSGGIISNINQVTGLLLLNIRVWNYFITHMTDDWYYIIYDKMTDIIYCIIQAAGI